MKHFLAIYMGSSTDKAGSAWAALDEKTQQQRLSAGMEAWGKWGQKYQDIIVDGLHDHQSGLSRRRREGVFRSPTFYDFPRRFGGDYGMSPPPSRVERHL